MNLPTDNQNKAKKLFLVEIVFLAANFVITLLMLKLWFYLFTDKIILTILIGFTLIGLMKQVWKTFENIEKHWQIYKDTTK